MKGNILLQIGIISGIALVVALLLGLPNKRGTHGFDERQLAERGKAAQFAMYTALGSLIAIYLGLLFEWLPFENVAVLSVSALVLTMLVFEGYCIFHDAFLTDDETSIGKSVVYLALGGLWMGMAWFGRIRGAEIDWIDLLLGIDYLGAALMLLIRMLYVRIRDRMEDGAEANG